MNEFDETMKEIKDNLIARIKRQDEEIEDLKEQLEYQDLWRKEYLNRILEARELLNQDWYSVLRKETIIKVKQILEGDSNVS